MSLSVDCPFRDDELKVLFADRNGDNFVDEKWSPKISLGAHSLRSKQASTILTPALCGDLPERSYCHSGQRRELLAYHLKEQSTETKT